MLESGAGILVWNNSETFSSLCLSCMADSGDAESSWRCENWDEN